MGGGGCEPSAGAVGRISSHPAGWMASSGWDCGVGIGSVGVDMSRVKGSGWEWEGGCGGAFSAIQRCG